MSTEGRRLSPQQLERRERVLDAAVDLATEGGYDAVQMRALAERSGVALATIYKYVGSKDQMLLEVIDRVGSELGRQLTTVAAQGATPAERIVDAFHQAHRFIEDRPQLVSAALHALQSTDASYAAAATVAQGIVGVVVPTLDTLDPDRLERVLSTIQLAWRTLMRDWVRGQITMAELNHELDAIVHLLLDG